MVKIHTLGWATLKWESNYNFRGSPQESRDPSPTLGSPAKAGVLQQEHLALKDSGAYFLKTQGTVGNRLHS